MNGGKPKWFTRLQVQIGLVIFALASILLGALIWLADRLAGG